MQGMQHSKSFICLSIAILFFSYSTVSLALTKTEINQNREIAQLRQLVLQQQKQMNEQTKAINELKRAVYKSNSHVKPQPKKHVTYNNSYSTQQTKVPYSKTYQKIPTQKAKTTITGVLNQAALFSNDGRQHDTFITTNQNYTSRVKVKSTLHPNQDVTLGGQVTLGFRPNASDTISQSTPTNSSIDQREVEIFLKSKKYGNMWLGKGYTASDSTAEIDFSGTDVIGYAGVADMGGGLYFRNPHTKAYTNNPQVSNVFDDLDGLGRANRFRYDTPTFAGFHLAASAVEDNSGDVALKFNKKFKGTHLGARIAYTSPTDLNDTRGNILDGSVSILFPCGINGTLSSGNLRAHHANRKDPHFYYFKLGLIRQYWQIGKTALAIDYGKYNNYAQNSDIGKSYGMQAVQNIKDWHLGIYAAYRRFMLSRTDARFKQIDTGSIGAIYTF